MAEKEQITPLPGSDAPVAPGRMNAFIDSLIGYVIDPAQWNALVTEIAKLDANIVSRDPADLADPSAILEVLTIRARCSAHLM
jgi:hypothetical protein